MANKQDTQDRTVWGSSVVEARALIKAMPRKKLEDLVVGLYGHLCCNEDGDFCDEESLAADSSADFVDACNELIIDLDGGPQGDHE